MHDELLETACILSDLDQIRDLLASEPDSVNRPDAKLHWPPLYRAVVANNYKVTQLLLENGADPSPDIGDNPLCHTVQTGKNQLAKLLLKYHAYPDLPQEEGFAPLHWAVHQSNITLIELLLNSKADPNLPVKETGQTPLHLAVLQCNEVSIRLLLTHGADPYRFDSAQKSPVDLASSEYIRHILESCQSENYSETSLELNTIELPDMATDIPGIQNNPPRHKLSNQELQQGKLYYWLESANLAQYYEIFSQFGSLTELVNKTLSPTPFTVEELIHIGVNVPGHCYKILILLDQEAGVGTKIRNYARQRKKEGCCGKKTERTVEELSLKEWLLIGGLSEIEGLLEDAGYDMELILMQAQSSYRFSHSVLKNELGMENSESREVFLQFLKRTLARYNMPQEDSWTMCVLF